MRRLVFLLLSIISALPAAAARADELWVGSTGSGAIHIRSAQITKVEGGMIHFTAAGNETSRELAKVQRIALDNEPALNAAEEAYAVGKWDAAVDGYQKTIRSTTKAWLKDWATTRLIDAANRSGRFDAAVSAYVAMLLKDPATAAAMRPAMPAQGSTYLDGAVAEVNQALNAKGLSDQQRQALLTFLMDLHRARNDRAAEQRVATQLDEMLARDPNNPAAAAAIARRKLLAASRALEGRDFRRAIDEINSSRDKFTEAPQQAEAMYILAEARYGLADPKSSDALKDAALAYMRVVAHFRNDPARPFVAQSLLRAAQIHEQLGEPQTAVAAYEQIVEQFKDDPAAQIAQQGLQRLGRSSDAGR